MPQLYNNNMRIYKNKWFAKFAAKESISDAQLYAAVKAAENGNIDADCGGGVIKQRIERVGEGKSGGYRSLILYRKADKAFFVYGFAKNERENISKIEEQEFKELAKTTFAFSENQLAKLIELGAYKEVKYDE